VPAGYFRTFNVSPNSTFATSQAAKTVAPDWLALTATVKHAASAAIPLKSLFIYPSSGEPAKPDTLNPIFLLLNAP
jgi:hypothetical protein